MGSTEPGECHDCKNNKFPAVSELVWNLLLQQDAYKPMAYDRIHSRVLYFANLAWTVLTHPLYIVDFVPSDFRLFRLVKDGLHGQHFPGKDAVLSAVKQWVHVY